MATATANLKLTKPDVTEFYDLAVQNGNTDKIDEAIAGKANKSEIPTSLPANGGNADTLDGMTRQEFFGNSVNQPPNNNLNNIVKTDLYEISPSGASNPTSNAPLNAWGLCIHYEHSAMKHQVAMYVVNGKPITFRRSFSGIPPWSVWFSEDSYQTLTIGTNILDYVTQSYLLENVVVNYRILNGTGVPTLLGYLTTNNDFHYTVYRINPTNTKVIAQDARSNREFVNTLASGTWTGWVEDIKSAYDGRLVLPKLRGGQIDTSGCLEIVPESTSTALSGNMAVDLYSSRIRFHESTNSMRGAYLEIPKCKSSANTKILTDTNVAVQSSAPSSPSANDLWIW